MIHTRLGNRPIEELTPVLTELLDVLHAAENVDRAFAGGSGQPLSAKKPLYTMSEALKVLKEKCQAL
jgi:hypothetical protein